MNSYIMVAGDSWAVGEFTNGNTHRGLRQYLEDDGHQTLCFGYPGMGSLSAYDSLSNFIRQNNELLFCLFKREDLNVWQGIAGGGEEGESATVSAKREALEEAGIPLETKIFPLDSRGSIPVINISGFIWGQDVPIIPEYSFGIELAGKDIAISHEHTTYEWVTYDQAMERLNWDSNKTALWELNYRLANNLLKSA